MRRFATLVAVGIVAQCVLSQEPAAAESRAATSIETHIKSLDNDSFEVRTRAMDELRAAGEGARQKLEAARKSESLEVRTRAESLLKELDSKKGPSGLKPLAPEAELKPDQKRGRVGSGAPRLEDFSDPNTFMDALSKWMEEQFDRDTRFPTFTLPDMKELEQRLPRDLKNDFVIVEPGDLQSGLGEMSVTTQKNGETVTFKNGKAGVSLKVQKKNDAGETVVESWEAKTVEEFKKNHPEIWEKYQPDTGMRWSVRTPGRIFTPRPGMAPVAPMPPVAIEPSSSPRLGVTTSEVPPILDKHLKLNGEGVVIETISGDTLASRIGLQHQDVLLALNGETIRGREDIIRLMANRNGGATVTAKLVREGAVMELSGTR